MALTFLWTDSKAWQDRAGVGSLPSCHGVSLGDWLALVTKQPHPAPLSEFLTFLGSKSELSVSVGLGFSLPRG